MSYLGLVPENLTTPKELHLEEQDLKPKPNHFSQDYTDHTAFGGFLFVLVRPDSKEPHDQHAK